MFYYITVLTDDVLSTNNNYEAQQEFCFKESFKIKTKEYSIMKYINFSIAKSQLGFSINQNDHIMELVSEWFPDGKFRKVGA